MGTGGGSKRVKINSTAINKRSHLPERRIANANSLQGRFVRCQCPAGPKPPGDLHALASSINDERPSIAVARRGADDALVMGEVFRAARATVLSKIARSGEDDTPEICQALGREV